MASTRCHVACATDVLYQLGGTDLTEVDVPEVLDPGPVSVVGKSDHLQCKAPELPPGTEVVVQLCNAPGTLLEQQACSSSANESCHP